MSFQQITTYFADGFLLLRFTITFLLEHPLLIRCFDCCSRYKFTNRVKSTDKNFWILLKTIQIHLFDYYIVSEVWYLDSSQQLDKFFSKQC